MSADVGGDSSALRLARVREAMDVAAAGRAVQLLAVSKKQSAAAIRALFAARQRAFGENYVQEARRKQAELTDLTIEWHLIGALQSNKCREAAICFDWIQSVDRARLIEPLAQARPAERPPLNVLIQVNIDGESSKAGCAPGEIGALANMIAAQPRLRLRGLMAIPDPTRDAGGRSQAFRRMHELLQRLCADHASADTLSMGMSGDFAEAISHGATMVRIGTALFGSRPST